MQQSGGLLLVPGSTGTTPLFSFQRNENEIQIPLMQLLSVSIQEVEHKMRLFHVSENPDIQVFHPRLPARRDLDPNTGLVWAVDEARLPNFLTPRDCPRVTYHAGPETTEADKRLFFSSSGITHAVVIEQKWYTAMQNTTLYVYEFDAGEFVLQDPIAGYYVSKTTQHPLRKFVLTDLFAELMNRNIEIRIVDQLWDIAEAVQTSSLNWSLCRMRNAVPRL